MKKEKKSFKTLKSNLLFNFKKIKFIKNTKNLGNFFYFFVKNSKLIKKTLKSIELKTIANHTKSLNVIYFIYNFLKKNKISIFSSTFVFTIRGFFFNEIFITKCNFLWRLDLFKIRIFSYFYTFLSKINKKKICFTKNDLDAIFIKNQRTVLYLRFLQKKYKIKNKKAPISDLFDFEGLFGFKFFKNKSQFELKIHTTGSILLPFIKKRNNKNHLQSKKSQAFIFFLSDSYFLKREAHVFLFSLILRVDHSSNIISVNIHKNVIQDICIFSLNIFKDSNKRQYCVCEKYLKKILEIKKKLINNQIKIMKKIHSNFKKLSRVVEINIDNLPKEFIFLYIILLSEKMLIYFPSCLGLKNFIYKKFPQNVYKITSFLKLKLNLNNLKALIKFFSHLKIVKAFKLFKLSFNFKILEYKKFISNLVFCD